MALVTTLLETKRILGQRSCALSRSWPGKCPYSPGDEILLSVDTSHLRQGLVPYAAIRVMGVRTWSVMARMNDRDRERLAREEGFAAGHNGWVANWRRERPNAPSVTRIRFSMIRVNDDLEWMEAAMRGAEKEADSADRRRDSGADAGERVQVHVDSPPGRADAGPRSEARASGPSGKDGPGEIVISRRDPVSEDGGDPDTGDAASDSRGKTERVYIDVPESGPPRG
tara:strand:+ start:10461 stop:11141 length:681 start_codon:yes stop_codon:yes gene_type:complete